MFFFTRIILLLAFFIGRTRYPLLCCIDNQLFSICEICQEFIDIHELTLWRLAKFLKYPLQHLQSRLLIAFGIGRLHATHQTQQVVGQAGFKTEQGKE